MELELSEFFFLITAYKCITLNKLNQLGENHEAFETARQKIIDLNNRLRTAVVALQEIDNLVDPEKINKLLQSIL
jgi:Tfp pilus assembly protein PilN